MSNEALVAAWKLKLPPNTKVVLVRLADHANHELECWPRVNSLAENCGMGPRAIRRHLEDLEKRGILVREARRNDCGRQTSNLYRLRLPKVVVQWQPGPGVTLVTPLTDSRGDATDTPRAVAADTPGGDATDTPLNPHREPPEEPPPSTPGRPAPPDDADDVVEWIPCSGKRPSRANRFGAPMRASPDSGWEYGVRQVEVDDLAKHYPGVDVPAKLYALAVWARDTPKKRRTYARMSTWLAGRCEDRQNRGGGGGASPNRRQSRREQRVAQGHNPHWKIPEPEDFVNTGIPELHEEAQP